MTTNLAGALEHNARRREPLSALSHIEVAHHMANGDTMMERVEPGKMAEHIAACPHCGSGSTTEAG